MRRRSVSLSIAVVLVAIGCGNGTKHGAARGAGAESSARIDTTVGHAPPGVRIKVEVLNASKTRGAARRATLFLRSRGYDVVAMGNSSQTQVPTLVLDRSNHPEWAALIGKAIGGKAVARPDTSRYLDATVVLGSDWTPPPMPFYP